MIAEYEDTAQHVAVLSDRRLDELIDVHIAKKLAWCTGYCVYHGTYSNMDIYECHICGATEHRRIDQRLSTSDGHKRNVPHYTADRKSARDIFDALRRNFKKTVLVCFVLNLHAMCPRWYSFVGWLLFDTTPQQIALAALQAVDVVDREGSNIPIN